MICNTSIVKASLVPELDFVIQAIFEILAVHRGGVLTTRLEKRK